MSSQNYTSQPSLTSRVESHIEKLIADHKRLTLLDRDLTEQLVGMKRTNRELEERVRRLERELSQRDLITILSAAPELPERSTEAEQSGEVVSEGVLSEGVLSEGVLKEGVVKEGVVSEGGASEGVLIEGVVGVKEGSAAQVVITRAASQRSRAYVNRLMREVDACIALMNAAGTGGK